MEFFQSAFFKNSNEFNQKLKTLSVCETTFPEMDYICENDKFWKELWKMMDEAKQYIWLMTYTYDDSIVANKTLKKLIEAQKRGVKVCLLLDDLNNRAHKELKEELISNGGIVHSLNQIIPYWSGAKTMTREMFRRHHEKVVIADDATIIGSANISDTYSGPVYGTYDFVDLNIKMKNLCLNQVRSFFGDVAGYYNYNLDPNLPNQEIIEQYNKQFSNSMFDIIPNVRLIRAHAPVLEEIQDFILQGIYEAKENIKIIQPYYYPIQKFEKALLSALKRGVSVEIITTAKRDQPAYASLKNILLMGELIKNGMKVFEIQDKLLHTKLYQYDDRIYTSGSFNNDWFSWDINNEMNIVVEGREEVDKMTTIFNDVKAQAKPLDPNLEVGLYRYMKVKIWEHTISAGDWLFNKKRHYKAEKKYNEYREFKRTFSEKTEDEAVKAFSKLKESKYKRIFMDWDDGLGNKL